MNPQIIIVSQAPLTPQIKRDTYLEKYIERNLDVKFWDISNILHPGIKYTDEISSPNKQIIRSYKELETTINQCITNQTVFQLDFDPAWNSHRIFHLLKKYNCKCIRVDMYANTCLHPDSPSITSRLKKLISRNIFKLIRNKLYHQSYKLYNHYIIRFSFLENLSSSIYSYRTQKINHPDYEAYMQDRDSNSTDYTGHILFIDTFFGFHPDMKYYHNSNWNIDVSRYHQSLKDFFDFLENKYKLPVIIAAHPKADYAPYTFGNRQIIKYQTLPLIKSANFIIAQICNTFSWIALSNKPFMLLANNEYLKALNNALGLSAIARTFGCKIQNIDEMNHEQTEFEYIPQENRTRYIYNYLTSIETSEKQNIDILIELISKITSTKG